MTSMRAVFAGVLLAAIVMPAYADEKPKRSIVWITELGVQVVVSPNLNYTYKGDPQRTFAVLEVGALTLQVDNDRRRARTGIEGINEVAGETYPYTGWSFGARIGKLPGLIAIVAGIGLGLAVGDTY